MEETPHLKLVPSPKKETTQTDQPLDPFARFKGVVLNLTQSALDCLNRISQQEMEKDSPSPTLMEEYSLLHHYPDFIKRLCEGRSG
jgi:hypothetical protein